jgi:signal transduction histidine kinase
MRDHDFAKVDEHVCRARVALSLVSLVTMYVDPMVGGLFGIDGPALIVLALHLLYALAAQRIVRATEPIPSTAPLGFAIVDVLFAAAIAYVTEGVTSPAYVFFCFAIIAIAFRQGLRATLRVTLVGIPAYLAAILLLNHQPHAEWMMRPGYVGLIGLFAGSLGQQRIDYEKRLRELEAAAERRAIARSLHDGYVQALAATRLRLEACRALVSSARHGEALDELKELQASLTREYDRVRGYLRSLAEAPLPAPTPEAGATAATSSRVIADFTASGFVAEEVLQILLEGLRNILRHGGATRAHLEARNGDGAIAIRVDDDGVGFRAAGTPPWSIASRVADLGGSLVIKSEAGSGAHLAIELPGSRV